MQFPRRFWPGLALLLALLAPSYLPAATPNRSTGAPRQSIACGPAAVAASTTVRCALPMPAPATIESVHFFAASTTGTVTGQLLKAGTTILSAGVTPAATPVAGSIADRRVGDEAILSIEFTAAAASSCTNCYAVVLYYQTPQDLAPPTLTENFAGVMSSAWTSWSLGKHTAAPAETPTTSPNVVFIDAPGRAGEKAWQITLETDDYTTAAELGNNRQRAEMIWSNPNVGLAGSDWWLAWSVRIPTGYVLSNIGSGTKWEIIGQLHAGPGVTSGPQPTISLRHESDGTETGDRLWVRGGLVSLHGDIDGEDPTSGGETEQRTTFPIARNTWVDVLLHVGFAVGNGNGYIETYVNGVQQRSDTGNLRMAVGTMYNAEPFDFRLGLYRGADPNPHTVPNTLQIQRVRIAKQRDWLRLP